MIEAELHPEGWQRIQKGIKHIDIRTETISKPEGNIFCYVTPDTGALLGFAHIVSVCTLDWGWTFPMVAALANISEEEAARQFSKAAGQNGIGRKPLYAYTVKPMNMYE